jgi:hypothetical protein
MNNFDELHFRAIIERHWSYHRACRHRIWKTTCLENGVMQFEVAPAFQEILGGDQDGLHVWTAYSMNLTKLFSEPSLEVTEVGFRSYCVECSSTPFVGIRGCFKNLPFILMIHLEPIADTAPVEVIDTIKNETRARKEGHRWIQ